VSVPEGEVRRISDFPVFAFTAMFSLWSYAWLVIVYRIWTPNIISMTEAVLTLVFEFILVGVSYLLDARPWQRHDDDDAVDVDIAGTDDQHGVQHFNRQRASADGAHGYAFVGPELCGHVSILNDVCGMCFMIYTPGNSTVKRSQVPARYRC
jgi:hypothetical protein